MCVCVLQRPAVAEVALLKYCRVCVCVCVLQRPAVAEVALMKYCRVCVTEAGGG